MACQFSNGPIKNFRTLSLWVFLSCFNYSLFIIVILPSPDPPHCKYIFQLKIQLFTMFNLLMLDFRQSTHAENSVEHQFTVVFCTSILLIYLQCNNMFSFLLFYWVSTFFYGSTTANLPFFLPLIFFAEQKNPCIIIIKSPELVQNVETFVPALQSLLAHTVAAATLHFLAYYTIPPRNRVT